MVAVTVKPTGELLVSPVTTQLVAPFVVQLSPEDASTWYDVIEAPFSSGASQVTSTAELYAWGVTFSTISGTRGFGVCTDGR